MSTPLETKGHNAAAPTYSANVQAYTTKAATYSTKAPTYATKGLARAKGGSATFQELCKRTVDVSGAVIGLMLLMPLFAVVAFLIKVTDPQGKVLFVQTRIGKDSRKFNIYKFRTMVHNAEARLKADPVLYKRFVANGYKLGEGEDPRITRIGRFLRKTSLDELPQLINVLRGEMSLVGPRPIVWDELHEYGDKIVDFLSVKPGVTGYWQVSGRSNVGYPERVNLELHYVYHQSLWFDLKILYKTVWIVLLKRGAV